MLLSQNEETTTLPLPTIILSASSTPYKIILLCPTKQLLPITILPKRFDPLSVTLLILWSCVTNDTSLEITQSFLISTNSGSPIGIYAHIVS